MYGYDEIICDIETYQRTFSNDAKVKLIAPQGVTLKIWKREQLVAVNQLTGTAAFIIRAGCGIEVAAVDEAKFTIKVDDAFADCEPYPRSD